MISLAAEGGYQVFTLNGEAWFWLIFSAVTVILAFLVRALPHAWRARRRRGHPDDDRDRQGHPGRRDGLPEAAFQDDRGDPDPAGDRRVRHVDGSHEAVARVTERGRRASRSSSRAPSARWRSSPVACVSGLTGFIGTNLAVRGNVRTAAAARSGSPPAASRSRSAPVASPACSPSAWVCSAPP